MATVEEFLATYEQFKDAYENTMSTVNKLKVDPKVQTPAAWKSCLKMIDETFELPLKIPHNMQEAQFEWSNLCGMVERLTMAKEDVLRYLQPKVQPKKLMTGLFRKRILGTAIFVASTLTLGLFVPGASGWFRRTVGKFVAPHGLQLLQKSIQYANTMQKKQQQNGTANNELDIASMAACALGAAKAIKNGYDLITVLKQQVQSTNQENKNS